MNKEDQYGVYSYPDKTYKKSNDLASSILNEQLTLNEHRVWNYAIHQFQNGKSSFHKSDLERQFGVEINTNTSRSIASKLLPLSYKIISNNGKKFSFQNVFQSIDYDDGLFTFKWGESISPLIENLKDNYISNDLHFVSRFKSPHTWRLYEFLKSKYGYNTIELSVDEALQVFTFDSKSAYSKNISSFKHRVLTPAIEEINEHTELKVSYSDIKKSRSIIAFKIDWFRRPVIQLKTDHQIDIANQIHVVAEELHLEISLIETVSEPTQVRSDLIMKKILNDLKDILKDDCSYKKAKHLIMSLNFSIQSLRELAQSEKITQLKTPGVDKLFKLLKEEYSSEE